MPMGRVRVGSATPFPVYIMKMRASRSEEQAREMVSPRMHKGK